uniref:Uncharacterized protein n=1 Tax=Chromera velia CCMP2878 TaxID=1169474 RepID=A0A0G4FAV5_9ALVE|eukprot:Cvel_15959.t1-p1 / transcript=Cvel_15959.t1 / gene=Cvel_15959 / organism=Chromera_velia_CCMP2878 / gene_product=hypothetical protein / transcript_product=hypothetical protein / location=Cvel_scaffold1207:22960-25760(+) / protein_length=509 / sequence_SO=supercontig / SO=protein_coding / is_pseudo=false
MEGIFTQFCRDWQASGLPHFIFLEEAIPYVKRQLGSLKRIKQVSREALQAYMADPSKRFPLHVWHFVCIGSAWAVMGIYSAQLGQSPHKALTGCVPSAWMLGDLALISLPVSDLDTRGQYVVVLTPFSHEQWAVLHKHPLDRYSPVEGHTDKGTMVATVLRVHHQQLNVVETNLWEAWLTPEERFWVVETLELGGEVVAHTLEPWPPLQEWLKYAALTVGGSGKGKRYGKITGGVMEFARPDRVLEMKRRILGIPTQPPPDEKGIWAAAHNTEDHFDRGRPVARCGEPPHTCAHAQWDFGYYWFPDVEGQCPSDYVFDDEDEDDPQPPSGADLPDGQDQQGGGRGPRSSQDLGPLGGGGGQLRLRQPQGGVRLSRGRQSMDGGVQLIGFTDCAFFNLYIRVREGMAVFVGSRILPDGGTHKSSFRDVSEALWGKKVRFQVEEKPSGGKADKERGRRKEKVQRSRVLDQEEGGSLCCPIEESDEESPLILPEAGSCGWEGRPPPPRVHCA